MGAIGWVIVLFVLGVAALFLEVVTPGGVVGSLGILFLVVAVVIAFTGEGATAGWITLVLAIVIGPSAFILGMKIIPESPLGKVLRHRKELTVKEGYVASDESLAGLLGKGGEAATSLRPAGMALIEGRRVDVVTSGFMIRKGARIRVVEVEGNRVVVEKDERAQA